MVCYFLLESITDNSLIKNNLNDILPTLNLKQKVMFPSGKLVFENTIGVL